MKFVGAGALTLLLMTSCASAADVSNAADESAQVQEPTETEPTTPTETTETTATAPTVTTAPTEPTEPTTPTETTAEPELAGPPKVGNCYRTGKVAFQQQRDGSFPVNCGRPHTAETFAVIDVGGSARKAEIDRVWRECQASFKRYVGDSQTVSTLGLTVIQPTADQMLQGQQWARCDAIELPNYNGLGGRLRTGSVAGALEGGVPDEFRGCVRHWPKVDQPVHFTSCRKNHQAELIPESLNLGGPDATYPGQSSVLNASKTFCANIFQDYVPETLNYYYYYPTASSWKSGSHDTTCWALDTEGDGLPPAF